ncbi:hypothetical protein [Sphingomonas oligoaromativorans]|uniref:hypothetical protein n=1 Tax=Sphingomonas oligoaromativorans TaxID=575322 RepID=UPI00141F7EC5|nr:hypothetical protein [Sphingomonas oligoaromativorans]NIJ35304.1 hypothetical protein [Sphingomonas oligoaromativorans]
MDINELLHREQVSLINAVNAMCEPSRHAHRNLAYLYGERLAYVGFPHRHFDCLPPDGRVQHSPHPAVDASNLRVAMATQREGHADFGMETSIPGASL